jgi:hypothetical protein
MFKKQWLAFLFAFVVPLVAVSRWRGGSSKVEITEGKAGLPLRLPVDHQGDVADAQKTQKKAFDTLGQAGLKPRDDMLMLRSARTCICRRWKSTAPAPAWRGWEN